MNRLFLLLFGMVTIVAHAQVPDYVPTEGLVSWYSFDGNVNDESGNENHAVESANANLMPSFVYDSHWNREVIEFDDIDDELTVLAPNQLGVGNEFSFSTWLIANEENHGQVVSMDAGRFSFFLHGANDHFDAQSSTSWASEAYYCGWNNHPYVHPDGWFHMTITISSDSIKAFGNGQFIAGIDCGGQSTFDTNIIFGYRNMYSSGDYHWGGRLADCGMWNRALSASEVLALYNAEPAVPGCTDSTACNYSEEANEDDGTCTYPPFGLTDCDAGGTLCGEGTIWDASLQACVGFNDCPSDLDGDGIVGVNDLLSLLSDFGTVCPPEVVWACGDPVNYHGYDYTTVQIGEQCWFAENLRTELYSNGDSIPGGLSNEEWASTTEGAQAVSIYGDALEMFGRAYNGYAVEDERGLCLSGWHVGLDSEWIELEMELGMSEAEANSGGWRGTDQGIQMKTVTGWSEGENGTNSSGFSVKPAGNRTGQGHWTNTVHNAFFWTPSSTTGPVSYFRQLRFEEAGVLRASYNIGEGLSVRCLKD